MSSPSLFNRQALEPLFRSFCAAAREASHEMLDEASLRLEAGDDAAWLAWEEDERFLAGTNNGNGNGNDNDNDNDNENENNALARGCTERVRVRIAATTRRVDVLDRLASDPRWRVREEVARRINDLNNVVSLTTMRRLVYDDDPAPRWQLASATHTPPAILRELAVDSSVAVRIAVASRLELSSPSSPHKNENEGVLKILARSPYLEVRRAVAAYQKPPAALGEDAAETVRVLVAANRETERVVVERLARDESSVVRLAVAASTNHSEILSVLFSDRSVEVRAAVAANEHTPVDLVSAFASDPSQDIRSGVARNPRAPSAIIDRLATDPSTSIRLQTLLRADAPAERFERLASDKQVNVRFTLARDARTPPPVLVHLARDSQLSVRCGVAENPSTPEETILDLASDEDRGVRQAVERRRLKKVAVTFSVAKPPIAQRDVPPRRPREIETILREAQNRDCFARARVASDRRTPDPILLVLSKDRLNQICGALVANAAADSAIVKELLARRAYLANEARDNPNAPFDLRFFPRAPRTIFEEVDD